MNIDIQATKMVQKFGASTLSFWWFVSRYGLYAYAVVVIGVAIMIGEKGKIAFILIPVAVTYLATTFIQKIIKRPRPKFTKTTFDLWMHTYSFPSGHSSLGFAFATSLSWAFLNSSLEFAWAYVLIFYILALCIAVSRLIVGVHYASDVLAGILLGFLVSVTLLIL